MDDLSNLNGIPQYIRIRESIRQRIKIGSLNRGDKLPPEEELAASFNVSRMTLRQSLSDLIEEGLLYRKHGVGTFVALQHFARDHSHLRNFFETSKEDGLEVDEQLLKVETIPARFQISKALQLAEGDPVVCLKTLRIVEGNPVTIHEAYFSSDKFPDFMDGDIAACSRNLLAFYESHGYKVRRGVQRLEARPADSDIAQTLKVEDGAPILYKQRVLYTEEGIPVEFLHCYNRGDLYSVTFNLQA